VSALATPLASLYGVIGAMMAHAPSQSKKGTGQDLLMLAL